MLLIVYAGGESRRYWSKETLSEARLGVQHFNICTAFQQESRLCHGSFPSLVFRNSCYHFKEFFNFIRVTTAAASLGNWFSVVCSFLPLAKVLASRNKFVPLASDVPLVSRFNLAAHILLHHEIRGRKSVYITSYIKDASYMTDSAHSSCLTQIKQTRSFVLCSITCRCVGSCHSACT
jgi:hypothetical protein